MASNTGAPRISVEIGAITTDLKKGLADARAEIQKFNKEVGKSEYKNVLDAERLATQKARTEAVNFASTLKSSLAESLNNARIYTENARKSTEDYRQTLLSNKSALEQSRVATEQQRQATEAERTALANSRSELARIAVEKRKGQQATVALAGSYREAQQRLTALGKSIREAEGGFTNKTRAIRAQINEYNQLNSRLKDFDRSMGNNQRNVGNYGAAFRGIGSQITSSLAPALLAFRALTSLVSAIGSNIQISDVLADVQRTAELSKKEVADLSSELSKIPTRTPLKDLLDISVIGGQLGIAKNELAGFTQALDFLGVALSKEIPGGAQVIAESLGKINGVFRVTQNGAITSGEAMQKTGSAILALGQAGLATGGFLVDFAQRVGGSATIANIALPSILAYGATLEEAGVSAEVAGTAVSKLIGELAKKREDFFAVAQIGDASLTLEKFTDLINTDAEKALQKFFTGLKSGGSTLTSFYDILAGAGIKSERYTNAILSIANNQSRLTELTKLGTIEFQKGTKASEQAAIRNLNLAGVIGQLGNRLKNTFLSPEVSQSLADWIGKTAGLITETDLLSREYQDLSSSINSQEVEVKGLINIYDGLIGNTNRTSSENTELGRVIKRIGEILPDAVTEWGKYGDALEINKDKVIDLGNSYKQLVRDMNLSNAAKGLKEFDKIQERIAKNETQLRFARQEKKYQPTLQQANLVQEEDINPLVQAIAKDNLELLKIAKTTQDTGNKLSKSQRDILIAFGEDAASEAMYRYDSLSKSLPVTTKAVSSLSEEVVKNKAYWEAEVESLTAVRDALSSADVGTKKWIETTNALKKAQAQVDLFSDKKPKGGSQSKKDLEEVKRLTEEITKSNLSAYDQKLFDIDKKYANIIAKISDPKLLGLAEQNKQAEVLRASIEQLNASLKVTKTLGSGMTTTTGVLTIPTAESMAGRRLGTRIKAPKIELDEFTSQFQSSLRRGLNSTFNDFFSGLNNLSNASYEVEKKYSDLRKDASASQIVALNEMERIERSINNGLTNTLSKIGSTFSQIGGNLLSSALSTGIASGDFKDIKGLFSGDKKAMGYGALGSLLGGALGGALKPTDTVGQGLSGALSGAGTGAAIGSLIAPGVGTIVGAIGGALIGGLSSIFGSSKAKKQEELAQKQYEEQKKQTLLMERQAQLAYSSQVIGVQTVNGAVTSIDRNEFGELVANIKGSDIDLVLKRYNSSRG